MSYHQSWFLPEWGQMTICWGGHLLLSRQIESMLLGGSLAKHNLPMTFTLSGS